jgi:Bacterial Ig-like domain
MHRRTLFTITAVLQPIGDLDKGKKYTVTITKEVEDQAGKKMA